MNVGAGWCLFVTRARFLWGATSSVEEIVSSMVSLQDCLTGLTLFHCARRLFLGADLRRPRPQFLPHNSCSGCTCPERCCEHAHWCSECPSSSVWVAVEETVAGVSQSHRERERPADWVLSLHCHGTVFFFFEGLDGCRLSLLTSLLCCSTPRSLGWPASAFA